MKKLIYFFVLVFCFVAGFAQDVQYTNKDLLDYLWCQPKLQQAHVIFIFTEKI